MTQKVVRDTLSSQDASTYLIWNSFLKEYRSFALLDANSRNYVRGSGHSDQKWNGTIRHSKMHLHTKLPPEIHLHTKCGISTSNNIVGVPQTQ